MSATHDDATAACQEFKDRYTPKYPRAVDCLTKDEEVLFVFCSFPAEQQKGPLGRSGDRD